MRAPGVHVAALGDGYVAYSGLSGESHVLNGESIAVLDALHTHEARSVDEVCDRLALEYQEDPAVLRQALSGAWDVLLSAGLVRRRSGGAAPLPQ